MSQAKIKRILAYTSISQIGFALMGVATGSTSGILSGVMFIFIYVFTMTAFFIILFNTSSFFYGNKLEYISDFTGLATSRFNSY